MTCGDFRRGFHAHRRGELEDAQVKRLFAHRERCAECDRFVRIAEEMTCKEFTELLNDYLEQVLPAGRREMSDRHLASCPDCIAYLQSYRATMKISAIAMRAVMGRLPDEMPEELIGAILAVRAQEGGPACS